MAANPEDQTILEIRLLVHAKDFDRALALAESAFGAHPANSRGRVVFLDARLARAAAASLRRGDLDGALGFSGLRTRLRAGGPPVQATARRLRGLAEHCRDAGLHVEVLAEAQDTVLRGPVFVPQAGPALQRVHRCPEVVAGVLPNATVTGGHNTIELAGGVALNDYGRPPEQRYNVPEFACNTRDLAVTLAPVRASRTLDRAVGLTGSTSGNYFHWLLEYLPALSGCARFPTFRDAPVLVDAAAMAIPQLAELLERVVPSTTRVVALSPGERVDVGALLAFSPASWLPQDLLPGFDMRLEDTVVSPFSVAWCGSLSIRRPSSAGRKLYLTRQAHDSRRLLNEREVEGTFRGLGYDIVAPETLSAAGQAELFASAARVCAPVGAGLANLVFCPSGASILALMNHPWETSLFSQITDKLGQELRFLVGDATPTPGVARYHERFVVPLDALGRALAALPSPRPSTQAVP